MAAPRREGRVSPCTRSRGAGAPQEDSCTAAPASPRSRPKRNEARCPGFWGCMLPPWRLVGSWGTVGGGDVCRACAPSSRSGPGGKQAPRLRFHPRWRGRCGRRPPSTSAAAPQCCRTPRCRPPPLDPPFALALLPNPTSTPSSRPTSARKPPEAAREALSPPSHWDGRRPRMGCLPSRPGTVHRVPPWPHSPSPCLVVTVRAVRPGPGSGLRAPRPAKGPPLLPAPPPPPSSLRRTSPPQRHRSQRPREGAREPCTGRCRGRGHCPGPRPSVPERDPGRRQAAPRLSPSSSRPRGHPHLGWRAPAPGPRSPGGHRCQKGQA